MVLGKRIHRSIDRTKLIDAHALVARIETRDETICEATSISLESNKKEVCKIEKPEINNEDIKRILIQLVGADRKSVV